MTDPHKTRIAGAFSRAASHYDQAADLQSRVARHLIDRLIASYGATWQPQSVLDVGCGTGLASRFLQKSLSTSSHNSLLVDIAPAMLTKAARHVPNSECAVMDGEALELGERRFDVILSSLAVQWFKNPIAALSSWRDLLRPGGVIAFATLTTGTFQEWREAYQAVGVAHGLPDYPPPEAWRGFDTYLQSIPMVYDSTAQMIRALKNVGVTTAREGYDPLSPGVMRPILRALGERPTLTYRVLYGFYRKA